LLHPTTRQLIPYHTSVFVLSKVSTFENQQKAWGKKFAEDKISANRVVRSFIIFISKMLHLLMDKSLFVVLVVAVGLLALVVAIFFARSKPLSGIRLVTNYAPNLILGHLVHMGPNVIDGMKRLCVESADENGRAQFYLTNKLAVSGKSVALFFIW